MQNLIPNFILENYLKNNLSGFFDAASLFIDISGFTQITEQLMTHDREGAEIISDILKFLFEVPVKIVSQNGGFIPNYVGDAFIALFPESESEIINSKESASERCLKAIMEISDFFKKNNSYESRFKKFKFNIKSGTSYGKIDWKIVGNETGKTYFFHGEAINRCCMAENMACGGEAFIDNNFYKNIRFRLPERCVEVVKNSLFFKILSLKNFTLDKLKIEEQNYSDKLIKEFTGDKEYYFPNGELRNVVTVYINFDKVESMDLFVNKVLQYSKIYGGSHPRLFYSDKGWNIVIYFGTPVSYHHNSDRALNFLMELKKSIDPVILLKAGVTEGLLYCGFTGSDLRKEFTCLGTKINLACRMMIRAQWGEVLCDKVISGNENFKFKFIAAYKFKGMERKIPVYRLQGFLNLQHKKFNFKVVGRDKDLAKLTDLLVPLNNSNFGGIVYIDGPTGVGKTTLINELRNEIIYPVKGDESYNWFYMPCNEVVRGSFHPLISFLQQYFNTNETMGKKARKRNFENKFKYLIDRLDDFIDKEGDSNSSVSVSVVSDIKDLIIRRKQILASLLNVEIEDESDLSYDAKEKYENTIFAIKNLMKAESILNPVVLVLEDGQWVDDDTKEMFKILCRNIDNFPILIIVTCRYLEGGAKFKLGLRHLTKNRIRLKNFKLKSSRELLLSVINRKEILELLDATRMQPYKAKEISPLLLNKIWETSSGNPFVVEQLVIFLAENKQLDHNLNLKYETIGIPSSVNDVTTSRIDELTPELKKVVKIASVLGQEFSVDVLGAIEKKLPVAQLLQEGENEFLWYPLPGGKYIFAHSLIREIAYNMQLKKHLREIHAKAGEEYEKLYQDRNIHDYYGIIAYHYQKSEIKDKTIHFLEKAGDYSKDNYKNQDAIIFYDRVLAYYDYISSINIENWEISEDSDKNTPLIANLIVSISKFLDILDKQGEVYNLTGKWLEADKNYTIIKRIAKKVNFDDKLIKCYHYFCRRSFLQGNFEEAFRISQKGGKLAEEKGKRSMVIYFLGIQGSIYEAQGKFEEAMLAFQKQKSEAEKSERKEDMVEALNSMGAIHNRKENYEEAEKIFNKSLKIAKEIDYKRGVLSCNHFLGHIFANTEKYDLALISYHNLLKKAIKLGDIQFVGLSYIYIGAIYQNKQKYIKAIDSYDKCLKILKEIDLKLWLAPLLRMKAESLLKLKRYDESKKCCYELLLLKKTEVTYVNMKFAEIIIEKINYYQADDSETRHVAVKEMVKKLDEIITNQLSDNNEDVAAYGYDIIMMLKKIGKDYNMQKDKIMNIYKALRKRFVKKENEEILLKLEKM